MEKLFDIMIECFPEDKDYDKLYRETYASKPDIQLHNMEKRHQMQLRKMGKLHAREIDEFYAEYSSKRLCPDNSILEKGYAEFSERVKLINNSVSSRSRSIIVIDDNDVKEEEYYPNITNINNSTRSDTTMHNKILDSNDDNIFFIDEAYRAIQNEYSNMRKAQFFLFDTLSYSHTNEKNIILKRSNKIDPKSKHINNMQENSNALPQQVNLNTTIISNVTQLMDKTVYSSTPSNASNKNFDIDASNGQFQLYVNDNSVSLQLPTNGALSVNDPVPLKQQMLASVIVDYLDTSNNSSPSMSNDLLQRINSSIDINKSNSINRFSNITLPMTWAQLIPLMNRVDTFGLETYYHESKDPRICDKNNQNINN
ncbi:108_t:CDS:2 [Entrophospora sp. SA101]|nr:413_t:CDS:2 [Entrophospora sp. SA101]CAJ0758754.1 19057_t:CDS:2 [Entrophospora sp. SA101]CAJ0763226.1 108_t:CDS:2 [Entrophospora sp. SA101]CAJ0911400.1 10994_t:CDS:2 [Entrophospora sp. SA101]CAJ0911410.1 11000_t:CDS:2 [Entrophospora sp. SA101]